jgi:hypothetical protein
VNHNHEREDLQLQERLQSLRYPEAGQNLWPAVRERLQPSANDGLIVRRLVPTAVLVIVWRALQLLFDLPLPVLHPIVPLVAAAWAVWQLAGDPLAIETTAPELQKRGI